MSGRLLYQELSIYIVDIVDDGLPTQQTAPDAPETSAALSIKCSALLHSRPTQFSSQSSNSPAEPLQSPFP